MSSSTLSTSPPAFRSKTVASLLAALFGWAGAHHYYLKRRYSWVLLLSSLLLIGLMLRAKVWYLHPAFFIWVLLASAGYLEAIVLALLSDKKFDARFNPGLAQHNQTGWAPVIIATLTLAFGTLIFMFALALLVEMLYGRFFA
ncbi:MAG: hypothetical protein M0Q54_12580 [Pigmentiphaga sp.]|nr:hypothetical protein [Pigmentiphaga sp.]